MKSAPFVMHQARSQSNILDLLDQYGEDARVIAGGQTLVPVLAMRVASPDHLIDINQVKELKNFGVTDGALVIHCKLGLALGSLNWSIGVSFVRLSHF